MTGNEAAHAAKKALSNFSICLGVAALAAAVAVVPADAKKNSKGAEDVAVGADASQPMTLVVSLGNQKVDIYRGTTLVTSSSVSTGKPGYATKAGVFSILEKRRRHFSNLYGGAPMPWMQRLTWSGTALHAGVVPGYPASHGCIRLPYSFAPKLFDMTTVGAQVVVSRGRVTPKPIEHAALFQPLPPPAPPSLARQEQEPKVMRRSSNETAPRFGAHLPVVLAKAETIDTADSNATETADAPASALEAVAEDTAVASHAAVDTPAPIQNSAVVSGHEDTRIHAIDPSAGPGRAMHALAVKPAATAGQVKLEKAKVEEAKAEQAPTGAGTPSDLAKNQDRLAPAVPLAAAAMVQTPVPAVTRPEAVESAEPQAGPILSVSARALARPVPASANAVVAMLTSPAHPPVPPVKPSVTAAKLVAGAAAAAVEAAEPRSTAPLRVLVTRRTQRDRMRDVQYILASMGHLEIQNFDGTFGRQTAQAIKAFQKSQDLPETGAFTDDVVQKIYEVAGKKEPAGGHLFVRQEFASVFDAPVGFRNPDEKLGTHVFTVMNFAPGDTKAEWMAISLADEDDPMAVLDRLEIPDDIRQNISERLTPGSTLIIADTAINSATLPKGADFLVWDTSKPATVQRASVKPRVKKRRPATTQRRATPSYVRRNPGWPF
jgi:peptidoglycan hydrolase-like protein with peptidoglycan-binding domain